MQLRPRFFDRVGCPADRRGQRREDRLGVVHEDLGQRVADLLGPQRRGLDVDARKDGDEFLATVAGHRILPAHGGRDGAGGGFQGHVTGAVAEAVVVDLEAIEVDHHHGDRAARVLGLFHLFVEPGMEIAVVGETRDRVGDRELLRLVEGVRVAHRNAGALGEGQHQLLFGLAQRLLASHEADDHVGDCPGAVEDRHPEPQSRRQRLVLVGEEEVGVREHDHLLASGRGQRQPGRAQVDAGMLRLQLRAPVDVEHRRGGHRFVLADQGGHLNLHQKGVRVEQEATLVGGQLTGLLELQVAVQLDRDLGERGMGAVQFFLQRPLGAARPVADEADENPGDGDEAGAHRQVGQVFERQRRAVDGVVVVDDRGVAERDRQDRRQGGHPSESDGRGDGDDEVGEEEG